MVGIGIIGCGGMGSELARQMVKVEDASLSAAYDTVPQNASKLVSELGGEVAASYPELLARQDVDAVIVATPGFLHNELVIEAAHASKHVFCEKPLALSLEDCDRMIEACDEAGVNLMVGQVLRLLPVFKESARVVRDELGKPVAMSTIRIGGWGYRSGWRSKMEFCGGMLLEVNVHEFDYLRHVLGNPLEGFAYGGTLVLDYLDFEDTVFASFKFENGAVGTLRAAVSSAAGMYTGEIICVDGTLFFNNHTGEIRYSRREGEEVVVTKDKLPTWGGVAEETIEFVQSIAENRRPTITGEDGRAAVEMALAARESIKTGLPVKISKR